MVNERTVPASAPTDSPTYTILVDGTALTAEYHVLSVAVTAAVNRIASARIMLLDGDAATQEFKASSADIFVPGKIVEILAGYHSAEESVFKGIVVKQTIRVRSGKTSLLTVDCRHKAVTLTTARKSAVYADVADSDVFDTILGAAGITADIESTSITYRAIVQHDATDWDFLLGRAAANGLVIMTEGDRIAITKPTFSSQPKLSLLYGDTILDLDVKMDARDQVYGTEAASWDMAGQQKVTAAGDEPSLPAQGNIDAAALAGATSSGNDYLEHGGLIPEPELKAWADGRLLRSRMARIQGRVRCTGVTAVRTGDLIELEGVGSRFSGKTYVSGVRHEIGGGNWSTDIQFGLSCSSLEHDRRSAPLQAGGLLPPVHGLQIGVALQLQDDPDGEFRVLVKVPLLGDEGVWARMALLDAGNARGSYFRPEVNDEVVLGFLNDDPRNPVILGMLNSSAKPAPVTPADDNHIKGFVTRSEIKFLFDDEKKSITAETPQGKTIIVSDDAGSIEIKDENGNTLTMNSDGISLESSSNITIKAGGDVSIEGMNTGLKANAQLKAEGSAGAEFTSSATAVLKGALVQIN